MSDYWKQISEDEVKLLAKEALEYKQVFQEMAYYCCRIIEGDDMTGEAYHLMRKYDLVDEDGFWKYSEDE